MLRPAPIPGSHDELFLARYQRLMRWALRLAAFDGLAKALVTSPQSKREQGCP
jgi:hypothetical protein